MQLGFLGAAGTVTGSKYLVEAAGTRLLVDCGLFQGVKTLRLRNWKPLPLDPATIDAVVLTHAHIDHSGYLPVLVRDGFEGPVYCSELTWELCRILLPDAAMIQEEDAQYANREGFSRHHPALPLYTREDADRALAAFAPLGLPGEQAVGSLRLRLQPAGHILGAASVAVAQAGAELLFSGDLGRYDDLLMRPPAPPGAPDFMVVESTYGDRNHPDEDPIEAFAQVLRRTLRRDGVLLVPAFAVGRTQTLLYVLYEIFRRGLAPRVPVYVDSPMATRVTELFQRSIGAHKLPEALCDAVCDVATYVRSVDQSRELTRRRRPAVIVSASGMATGGRVLHHLRALAPEPRNTVLFPGFQAPGTRGDAIVRGARFVKIHGRYVPIEAEVVQLDVYSAHADQRDLLRWVGAAERPPREVFVTHGEPVPADVLRRTIGERTGFAARVPEHGERVSLEVGDGPGA